MSIEKFDVIVVGGGPAGLSAAFFLSKYGLNTLLIEKGVELGTKNVFGGRIYSYILDKYYPGWRNEAPIERWVRSEKMTFLDKEEAVTIEYRKVKSDGFNSFNTFLSKFLRWMGDRAESEGAVITTGVKVDHLVMNDDRIVGVYAEGDEILSDYVIIAEGTNSLLCEKHGLKKKSIAENIGLGIKEVIRLEEEKINKRFNLLEDEGVAQFFIGYPLNKHIGGGFLYTMKNYVTLGVVVNISSIKHEDIHMKDIVEDFRTHPYIKSLVADGTLIEYSSHIVSEGGLEEYLNKPYGNGYLIIGDAGGLSLNTGFTIRGVDFAIESGRLAAETIKSSHENGDTTEASLSKYKELLENSIMYRSLYKFRKIKKMLSNKRLYNTYPEIICKLMSYIYTTKEEPYTLKEAIKLSTKDKLSNLQLLKDLYDIWRRM